MASSSQSAEDGPTPAQRMAARHTAEEEAREAEEASKARQATVQDVVDEEDIVHPPPSDLQDAAPVSNGLPMSAKAAGKRKAPNSESENSSGTLPAQANRQPQLDPTDEDAFPSLAAPTAFHPSAGKWSNKPASIGANGASSMAAPRGPTHLSMPMNQRRSVNLPNQASNSMVMETRQVAPQKGCPYKTTSELVKSINKKYRVTVKVTNADGNTKFHASGPTSDVVNKALKEIAAQWGIQQNVTISVPTSLLPQIIGRQGAKIKEIQERSGARIHTSRNGSRGPNADGNEDSTIEIQGNPLTAETARRDIQAMVGDRTPTSNLKVGDIPPELFPFIAGPHNSRATSLEDGRDVRITVPHYHTAHGLLPEQVASFAPHHAYQISIQGERELTKQVQAEIQRHVGELKKQLTIEHLLVERERHRFVLEDRERSLHDFLQQTGCSIIMPSPDSNTEAIAIVGPADRIKEAVDQALDVAAGMRETSVDISRLHTDSQKKAQEEHTEAVTRYLQQRQALNQLEMMHNSTIVIPTKSTVWKIYSRDGKNGMRARADITNLVGAHPPARFRSLHVHPYYQQHLADQHAHLVREKHGVYMVFAEPEAEVSELLLVYENPEASTQKYEFPRSKPSGDDATKFQESLAEAEAYLLGLFENSSHVVSDSVDAPLKYREKLQRYIESQKKRSQAQFPIQFMGFNRSQAENVPQGNMSVEFRGPATEVDTYRQILMDFIEEQIRDEAERDYTTSCDFPQKYANQLIGRKGENINRLRQEHDVEIQLQDGKAEIKGPERKANKAKNDIMAIAKKAEDETTHILKINPRFHGNIIGAGGETLKKLQNRYHVQISFPKVSKGSPDNQSLADGASDAGAPSKGHRPSQAADEVIIRGPSRGANDAWKELEELSDYVLKHSASASVSVAQSFIPSLIGAGGKELENLRLETGAKIDVPGSRGEQSATGRVEVQIKGTKEQVDKARKAIQTRAKTYDESVRRTLKVEKKHHRALIGRNGDNISALVVKAGGTPEERARLVRFPPTDSHDNAVYLDGNAAVVDQLAAAIEAFVLNREQQVTETLNVASERHGALIGAGGETRKRLESEFNISINIPDRHVTGPARSEVRISGLPADVEKAKIHISDMTKGPESETVLVPLHLHHALYSANIQKLRNMNVRLDYARQQIPPRDEMSTPRSNGVNPPKMPLITDVPADSSTHDIYNPDRWNVEGPPKENGEDSSTIPWVLKGSEADLVARAREMIEAALDAESHSATGYLSLPEPSMNQYVIGPGGSTIKGIRAETGCIIEVPKRGSTSEVITIKGQRDAVGATRDLILEAVSNGLSR